MKFTKDSNRLIARLDRGEEFHRGLAEIAIQRGYDDLNCWSVDFILPSKVWSIHRLTFTALGYQPAGTQDDNFVVRRRIRSSGDGEVRSCLENVNPNRMPQEWIDYGIRTGQLQPPPGYKAPSPATEREIDDRQ